MSTLLKKSWRKKVSQVLVATMAVGSFAGPAIPQKASAAGGAGGVNSSVYSVTYDVYPGGVKGAALWLKADKDALATGGQLTGWTDQTGTNQFTVHGSPDYKAAGANFNPAVSFENTAEAKQNPNEYLKGNKPITFKEGYAVFQQTDGTVVGSAAPGANYGVGIFAKNGSSLSAGNGTTGTYINFPFNGASRFNMTAFDLGDGTNSKGWLNGKVQSPTGTMFNSITFTPVIGGTFGGDSTDNWDHLKGDVAEVILFPSSNTAAEKHKIESYLAIKYGLTLNEGKTDYIASGTAGTKMWSAADNEDFGKRITGIGKDSGSGLEQKQSKSQDTDALVTIALGQNIAASNKDAAASVTNDQSFLVFGDNGLDATNYTVDAMSNMKRSERIYKVDKTNWQDQAVTLQLSEVTAEATHVLISSDATFPATSDTKAFALQSGGKVTIDSSILADSSYFTFSKEVAGKAAAPGGVKGAALWLKADKDASANPSGQLAGWTDQTGTNQFTVKGSPDYKSAPANFNPAVAFQNTTAYNQNPSEYMIGNNPITFQEGYAVMKQTDGTIVGSAAPVKGGYGVGIFSKWAGKLWTGNGANGTYHGFSSNDASRFNMAAMDMVNSSDSIGRLNGVNQTMTRNKTINSIAFTPVIGGTFGGGSSNNWNHYKGDIAEVVLFPSSNTSIDKMKIESYLALKYGLTLNNGASDYTASNYDGSTGTKMWTAADNAGYGKRITGIGRDDGSELLQKQSKSQDAGALITVALGDEIMASNAQNGNAIANNLSFFTFSDNGTSAAKYDGETGETTTDPQQHKLKLLNREFKVDKTNWQDTDITLKLDITAENPAALYYLVIRNTAGAVAEIIPLTAEGIVKINSTKLADGSTITFAKVTKDALQKAVSGVDKLTAANYTPDSWAVLQNALAAAKDVLSKPNATQQEVDQALAALEAAKQGLSSMRDKLEAKVNQIQSAMDAGTLKEGDYTADSWQALKNELNQAKAVLAQSPAATEQEIGQALTKLDTAKGDLVDLSALRAKVNEIDSEGLTPSGYSAASWQAFQEALSHAKNVLVSPSATQAEVDSAKAALEAARAALVRVDKAALQAKVNEINGETDLESILTPESWGALKKALDEAQSVLDDPNATQAEVDRALAALQAARQNAVIAGAELSVLEVVYSDRNGNPVALELSPAFNGNQYLNYSGVVPNEVSSISLDPQTSNPNSQVQITVNGQVIPAANWNTLPLKEGRNVIEVEVTDPNGNKNKYSLEIFRVSNKLVSLIPSKYSFSEAFESDKAGYVMTVPSDVSQLHWTPTAIDPQAKIEISVNDGAYATVSSGTASPAMRLNVGANKVVVKVTDRDGGVKEYVVTVYRNNGSTTTDGGNNNGGTNTGGTNTGGGTPPANGNIVSTVNDTVRDFATGKSTTEGGQTQTAVQIDAGKLNDILAQGNGQKLAISVPNNGKVEVKGLTAEQVKRIADAGSSLQIGNLLAIYPVPGGQLDFDAISKNLNGAKLGDIAVHIDIERSPEALINSARGKATAEGYELLVDPVDLQMTFTNEGRTVSADQLNGYAARFIALPEGTDPNRITTGVVVNPDGTMFHLPTVVTKINNRYYALIHDLRSSGTYSVIWNPKDFDDVKGHWARTDINNIAARLDLEGTGNNTFTPERDVIRSEFAAIVASGMGLMRQTVQPNKYGDVSSSDWYHDAVSIATEFGIVLGYDDGLFHGGLNITREQGIAMIARAYILVEPLRIMSQTEIDATLEKYGDADNVSGWAKEAVAKMIAAGIVEGEDGQLLNPLDNMSRAEATALMRRLLQTTDLID